MSTETTNKKIKIDNGTTFGRTYTDKAVDERLQGLVSTTTFTPVKEKADNSLQKPTGLTKTKLVGVGTNGQENIEIGDNLTLANGKLSATGGGSGGDAFDVITLSDDGTSYTGTFTGTKPTIIIDSAGESYLYAQTYSVYNGIANGTFVLPQHGVLIVINIEGTNITSGVEYMFFNHFVTLTNSSNNIALYLTIQNIDETLFTADDLASYLADKKLLVNGNLHGVVPTYIAGEGGVIKIYYITPGDSNINPTPDEFQDLSSFTITDLVTPVV